MLVRVFQFVGSVPGVLLWIGGYGGWELGWCTGFISRFDDWVVIMPLLQYMGILAWNFACLHMREGNYGACVWGGKSYLGADNIMNIF